MRDKKMTRAIAAAAVAAMGVAAAWWAGAAPAAALLALFAGILAFALLRAPAPAAAAEPAPEVEAYLPEGPDLLAAFGEPLLVVRDRRVLIANAAARALLGDHIQGRTSASPSATRRPPSISPARAATRR
jgi:two-component system phosphate regulon sensor histidine kinase PhoR